MLLNWVQTTRDALILFLLQIRRSERILLLFILTKLTLSQCCCGALVSCCQIFMNRSIMLASSTLAVAHYLQERFTNQSQELLWALKDRSVDWSSLTDTRSEHRVGAVWGLQVALYWLFLNQNPGPKVRAFSIRAPQLLNHLPNFIRHTSFKFVLPINDCLLRNL